VLGLEVVLASGQVIPMGGALEKNNTGLDVKQFFIGTEGTLGVITQALLKLAPLPRSAHVMLFALESLQQVLQLFKHVRASGLCVSAYEFFTQACLNRLQQHRSLKTPWSNNHAYYVLLEVDELHTPSLDSLLEHIFAHAMVSEGVMAQTETQAAQLWALREGISESLSATGFPHKNDISLPIAALEGFCRDLETLFSARYPAWEVCVFGHIGDGNLHVNVMKPEGMGVEEFKEHTHGSDTHVFALVQKHGGSISAEHGVGLLKKDFLHYTKSAEEMACMRQMKKMLDPQGILNPGKIF
jgi:FAD/FMN-containing dehydrogenase